MKFKAIIFDMDGLMIDSESIYHDVERKIAKLYGKEVKQSTLNKMMGRSGIDSMIIFLADLGLDLDPKKMLDERDVFVAEELRTSVKPMPGLHEILDEFHGRLDLAIATSAHKEFLDIVIDKFDIRSCFRHLQTNDNVKNAKPDPEIYLKTVDKLGYKPEECFVLEDSFNGTWAGKKAGCYTIAVPNFEIDESDFSHADYQAKDLFDAIDHINSLLNKE